MRSRTDVSRPATGLIAPTCDAALDRLADSIHDGVVQDLVAARYLLDLLADSHPDGELDNLTTAIRDALVHARALMAQARSQVRDGRGLSAALRELAAVATVPAELSLDLPNELEPGTAVTVYRLAQAIFQGAQAGGASHVAMRADTRGQTLRVTAVITGGSDVSWVASWEHHLLTMGGSMDVEPLPEGVRVGSTIVMERRPR